MQNAEEEGRGEDAAEIGCGSELAHIPFSLSF